MAQMRSVRLIFVVLCAASRIAFGWGCEGHDMVALIARTHLTSGASSAVDRLLIENPIHPELKRFCTDRSSDPMIDAATWADDVKSSEKTGLWHYIDIPLGVSSSNGRDLWQWCPPLGPLIEGKERSGCILNALNQQITELAAPNVPGPERARALRYVIHLMGDLHQPLHTEDNGDQGGNCTSLKFFGRTDPVRLHGAWDYGLIERDMALQHSTTASYASALDRQFAGQWLQRRNEARNFESWAWESHELARNVSYGALTPAIPLAVPGSRLSCDAETANIASLGISIGEPYFREAMPVIDEQLAKSGYRLAALLNQTFR